MFLETLMSLLLRFVVPESDQIWWILLCNGALKVPVGNHRKESAQILKPFHWKICRPAWSPRRWRHLTIDSQCQSYTSNACLAIPTSNSIKLCHRLTYVVILLNLHYLYMLRHQIIYSQPLLHLHLLTMDLMLLGKCNYHQDSELTHNLFYQLRFCNRNKHSFFPSKFVLCNGCGKIITNPPETLPDDLVIVYCNFWQFRDRLSGQLQTSASPQNVHFHLKLSCILTRYSQFRPELLHVSSEYLRFLRREHYERLSTELHWAYTS